MKESSGRRAEVELEARRSGCDEVEEKSDINEGCDGRYVRCMASV